MVRCMIQWSTESWTHVVLSDYCWTFQIMLVPLISTILVFSIFVDGFDMDVVLARTTTKCDKHRELHDSVNPLKVERILFFRVISWNHVCGVCGCCVVCVCVCCVVCVLCVVCVVCVVCCVCWCVCFLWCDWWRGSGVDFFICISVCVPVSRASLWCHAGDGVRWMYQVVRCKSSVGHVHHQFVGQWQRILELRMPWRNRGAVGVVGVNRVWCPRMWRLHVVHQIQMQHWKLHGPESPVWRLHWLPWEVIRAQKWKAKQAAEERPLEVQLAQTDAFIERSRFRIQKLVQERNAETELLDAALQRQSRLREQIATAESVLPPRAPVPDAEWGWGPRAIWRRRWNNCKWWWLSCKFTTRSSSLRPNVRQSVQEQRQIADPGCRKISFQCATRMLCGGQADMQDATAVGNAHELARLCRVVATVAQELSQRATPSLVANAVSGHWGVVWVVGQPWHSVVVRSLCGLRGVRVGEASNPGPKKRRRRVTSSPDPTDSDRTAFLDGFEQDLCPVVPERHSWPHDDPKSRIYVGGR